jgi:hypothetical protein
MLSLNRVHLHYLGILTLILLKGPAAEAADAPQPLRFIVQPCEEDYEVSFLLFHVNGAPVE